MAISYTNQIKIILDSVEKLLEDEFNIPVQHEHSGNESIVINPAEDTLISYTSDSQIRNYDIDIIYTMSKAGGFEHIKDHLTNRSERIKRLLFNNTDYQPSGTYKFHDGKVDSIAYSQSEDDPELWMANLTFSCTVHDLT